MNKRFFLMTVLPAILACSVKADQRFLFDFSDHIKQMQEMHEEMMQMHQQMTSLFSSAHKTDRQALQVSASENSQSKTFDIVVTQVETKQDKPEAQFSADSATKEITLEIPLTNGTLGITNRFVPAYGCWLITTTLKHEQSNDSDERKSFSSMTSSQTITTSAAPDFNSVPELAFDKETKTVTVSFKTQQPAAQKSKTVIPVAIK